MSRDNKVILKSSDNQIFNVDKEVAQELQLLKNLMEDMGTDNPIPVLYVHSTILAIVIEYCEFHVDSQIGELVVPEDELKKWDADFIGGFDYPTLVRLANAATFLQVESLLDLSGQAIANVIEGKTAQEIRELCNIKNDLTPEEEEKFRQEHGWILRDKDQGRRKNGSSTPSSSRFG